MKKNIIIHIGLHKTASTFLQTYVFPRFDNCTLLTRPFTQYNEAFNRLQYADDTLYDKSQIESIIESIQTSNIILSDENLSGKLFFYNALNRSLIAKRLCELFPEAKIVIVLRNQMDFINSAYNNYIKGVHKGKKGIHKFIKYESKAYDDFKLHSARAKIDNYPDYLLYNTDDECLNLEVLKYSKLLELYKSLFPEVKVLLYEDFLVNPGDFLNELEFFIDEKCQFNINGFKNKVNASLTQSDLYAQLKLNQQNCFKSKIYKSLFKLYFNLNRKTLFSIDESFIKMYYEKDNLALERSFQDIDLKRHNGSYF